MTHSRGQLMFAKLLSGPLGRLLLLGAVIVVVTTLWDPMTIIGDLSTWLSTTWDSISNSIGISGLLGGLLP